MIPTARLTRALFVLLVAGTPALADLRGLVISTSGDPISNATVAAYPLETSAAAAARLFASRERVALAQTRSSESGDFNLDVARGEFVVLVASAPGFAPAATHVAAGADQEILALQPRQLKTGRITAAGKPIGGARVVFSDDAHDAQVMVTSADDGTYQVPDPEGWAASVVVIHPDFAPKHDTARSNAAGIPAIELDRGRAVSGTVVQSGRPVNGAEVLLGEWPVALTDEQGRFTIPHAPKDADIVLARHGRSVGAAKIAGSAVNIELQPGAAVHGTVRDDKGVPLKGVLVAASSEKSSGQALTDHRGQFRIEPLVRDKFWVGADLPGYEEQGDERVVVDLRRGAAEAISIVLKQQIHIRGRVVDEANKGVGGAFVMLYPAKMPFVYTIVPQMDGVYTRPDGSFRLPHTPDERTLSIANFGRALVAYKPGHPVGFSAALPDDLQKVRDLTVKLPAGVEVTGTVVGPHGQPVANTRVAVVQRNEDSGISVPIEALIGGYKTAEWPRTAGDGTFRLRLNPGSHDFAFSSDGFATKAVRAVKVSDDTQPIAVKLEGGVTFSGRVLHHDGAPISDAIVGLQSESNAARTTTDSTGAFAFDSLSAGSYQLVVVKPDDQIMETRQVTIPGDPITVSLRARTKLHGRVRAKRDGAPISKFRVEVSAEQDTHIGYIEPEEFDSPDGTFAVPGFAPGSYQVQVSAEGYAPASSAVLVEEKKSPAELIVELEPGVALRGRVSDRNGSPVAGVAVTVSVERAPMFYAAGDDEIVTDADGLFEVPNLRPGQVSVELKKQGFVSKSEKIDVAADSAVKEFVLAPGADIRGMVMAGNGTPLSDVQVRSQSLGEQGYEWAETQPDGSFMLSGLIPGKHRLEFSRSGYANVTQEAVAGTEGEIRIVMNEIGTATIFGTVRGADPNALLRMVTANAENSSLESAPIDASGNYRIEKAPTGRVEVTARLNTAAGARSLEREVEVLPGSEVRVDFDFDAGAAIKGRVLQDDVPLVGAMVSFRSEADESMTFSRTGAGGVYEVRLSSEGPHDVWVSSNEVNESFTTKYDVRSSGTFDIHIRRRVVTGRVLDAHTEQPVVAAEVTLTTVGNDRAHDAKTVKTDREGRFALFTTDTGAIRLRAVADGYGQEATEVPEAAVAEAVLRLKRSEGLTVRLQDARTGNALDAIIVVRDEQNHFAFNGTAEARTDGTIRLPLARGSYKLSASSRGYATQSLPVTVPSAEVRLGLTPGGTLVINSRNSAVRRARLIMPNGDEYIRCECNGIAELKISGVTTTIENIAPGVYQLQVEGGRAYAVQITEGQTTTAEID